eukprot:SAG22_NODE_3147_length_1904_cov_1.777285_3_plen_67_part_01
MRQRSSLFIRCRSNLGFSAFPCGSTALLYSISRGTGRCNAIISTNNGPWSDWEGFANYAYTDCTQEE